MPVPAKPRPVEFLEVEETEINVQWEPVEGATGYKIFVKDFSIEGDWNVPEVMKHEFDGSYSLWLCSVLRKVVAVVIFQKEALHLPSACFCSLFFFYLCLFLSLVDFFFSQHHNGDDRRALPDKHFPVQTCGHERRR